MENQQVSVTVSEYCNDEEYFSARSISRHPADISTDIKSLILKDSMQGLYAELDHSVSLTEERPRMILNPNTEDRDEKLKQIDLLDGSCPIRIMDYEDDTECPCDIFIHQGKCAYGLFVKKEN